MACFCLLLTVAAPLELCPAPQDIDLQGKHVFRLVHGTPIVVADDVTEAELAAFDALFEAIGFKLPIRRAAEYAPGTPSIYVGEWGRNAALELRRVRKFMARKDVGAAQGYRLTIDQKAIVVAGADVSGTFNGLQTLIQAAKRSIELPCLEVCDYPDLHMRGVYLKGPATRKQLRQLAAVKCNLAVFTSDDFYRLTGDAAATWKRVFADARALHIEPVPLIPTLAGAAPLVAMNPVIAEGRVAVDRIVLDGDDWKALSRRNIIVTETSPMRVQVSGHLCTAKADYTLDPGALEPPFAQDRAPWLIRRIPGGAIPDGATVTVTYTYVPPGTTACCPNAPETGVLLRDVVGDIVRTLDPRFIHIAHGSLERLNKCLRCQDQNKPNAAVFADSVAMLDEIAKEFNPNIRMMLWADAINPLQNAARYDLADAAALLPRDVIVTVRLPDSHAAQGHPMAESVAWCARLGLACVGAPGAGPSNASAWCDALRAAGSAALGVIYVGDEIPGEAFTLAMEKSWSLATPRSVWTEAFNAYFDAALWRPQYAEVLETLAAYVNRHTLAGVQPESHYEAFKDRLKRLRKNIPDAEAEIRLADWVYRNLVTYLELEAAFVGERRAGVLRDLAELVEVQGEIDPDMTRARIARIIETVETKGLFVPSTILFGRHILPYRPMQLPAEHIALEVALAPEYADTEHRCVATYDFLAPPGPICRIDFETIGTVRLDVEYSKDGKTFGIAQQWTSQLRGGVSGPAVLNRPFSTRFLRITAHATAEHAVLRNARVFALKSPPRLACDYAKVVPATDDAFEDILWPDSGRAAGFVRVGEAVFAEAQTTVRVCRTRDGLVIGALAHEPRMRTLVATQTRRDAPLWDQESFELLLHTGHGEPFRFVVNPLGAQFDSRGWDPGWDGPWQVVTQVRRTGWSAVIALPFDTLGTDPNQSATWRVNFVRNRYNVRKERSAWSHEGDPCRPENFGTLTFN